MKRKRHALLFSACVTGWLAAGLPGISRAQDPAPPERGRTHAVAVERVPTLDGTLNDPAWNSIPKMQLGACTSHAEMPYDTWAVLLFDPTHVTIGVYCAEPDTDGIVANAIERDGPVWQDDAVEIFLRADPEEPYRHFAVNPRGVVYDALEKDKSWKGEAEIAAAIDPGKAWTATFRIPMRALNAYVGDAQTWRLNITRSRQPRGEQTLLEYAWAVLPSTQFHAPQAFGIVEGVNVPRRDDGVTRERAVPAPPPDIPEPGSVSHGVTVYRQQTFDDSANGWEPTGEAALSLITDGPDGGAVEFTCSRRWDGAQLPIRIAGSEGLKLAFHVRAQGTETVMINVNDGLARDNTTSYAYRRLAEDEWTPVLYYLDRFRYNSRDTGFVAPQTDYRNIRFFVPATPEGGSRFALDNLVLYRGADGSPPGRVTELLAETTPEGVRLAWTAAPDNVAPMVYAVARAFDDGPFVKIAESVGTTFFDRFAPAGNCRYRVLAIDFEENAGPWSEPVAVESRSEPAPHELSVEETDRLAYASHIREVHARGAGQVRRGHVAMFGDSLTFATSYRQAAKASFLNLRVSAFGYPRMRTSYGREHVERILAESNPEYLCVLFGTNNTKSEQAIASAMEDLAAIVKACEANGTVALLGTIPPRGFSDPASAPEAAYNQAVVELGRKLQVPVAYIFESIQTAGERRQFISGDGVHWNANGMAVAGAAWARALGQVRFVLRDRDTP